MTTTRAASTKQEKQIAKQFGGKLVTNSGATLFRKGDVTLGNILVEAKTTMKKVLSFPVKKEWLTKIEEAAFVEKKDFGVLAINFEPDGKNYFVLNERAFETFLIALNMEARNKPKTSAKW